MGGMRHNGHGNADEFNGCAKTSGGIMNPNVEDKVWISCNNVDFRKHWRQGCLSATNKACLTGNNNNNNNGNCKDINVNCKRWTSLCSWHSWVKSQCNKTCKLCDGSGGGTSCKDGSTNCPW